MSLTIPYSELNTQLSAEQNAANMAIVAEIIRTAQLRSIGINNDNDCQVSTQRNHKQRSNEVENYSL